jgi:hypothetical protein
LLFVIMFIIYLHLAPHIYFYFHIDLPLLLFLFTNSLLLYYCFQFHPSH